MKLPTFLSLNRLGEFCCRMPVNAYVYKLYMYSYVKFNTYKLTLEFSDILILSAPTFDARTLRELPFSNVSLSLGGKTMLLWRRWFYHTLLWTCLWFSHHVILNFSMFKLPVPILPPGRFAIFFVINDTCRILQVLASKQPKFINIG